MKQDIQTYQDKIEDLSKYTVAIQEIGGNGSILGTGVIVTDDGLILTCYHVVKNHLNQKSDNIKRFNIYFPNSSEIRLAQIKEEYCNASEDIALLELLEKKLPSQAKVSQLSESIYFGNPFASLGFRKAESFDSLTSKGEIRKITDAKQRKNADKSTRPLLQIYSDEIDSGMSGAPVLDLETNKVVGIVSEHWITTGNVDKELNFAIPIESVIGLSDDIAFTLKEKNPGLLKIKRFLEKIGLAGNRKYQKIDYLFIPPLEYERIKETLLKDKIVFITGTKEYGKTYTAIRLLWEYFNDGYEPVYFKEEWEDNNRNVVKKLIMISDILEEHHVYYFEDPFGRTKFEPNADLQRSISSIIDTIKDSEDAYVIVTSREEIYKEFLGRRKDLKEFEEKMNIKTPSYDFWKRKDMLLRWAEAMNSAWLTDDSIRNIIFKAMEDETTLPTPLNINNFVNAVKKERDIQKILYIINQKSLETAESFGIEIDTMLQKHPDRMVFLSFPFISDGFSEDFVKSKYEELIKDLKDDLESNPWNFNGTFNYFKEDKIEIKDGNLRFSHPSYSEAIKYIISEDRFTTKAAEILQKVIEKIAESKYYNYDVAIVRIIVDNFNRMPSDSHKLFFELLNNKSLAYNICLAIVHNFDNLPKNVQNILFKFVDTSHGALSSILESNFDELPENTRNELLVKLADKKSAIDYVVRIIVSNFDKLPENIQNILFTLNNNEAASGYIARNADKLPQNVQNLLLKLVDNNDAARQIAYAMAENFDKLPENMRNELLVKLADNKAAAGYVASVVARNFEKLPQNVQNLLLKLVDNNDAASAIAFFIDNNFDKLPENTRNELLVKLADTNAAAVDVGIAIDLGHTVESNFDKLPENMRNELLVKLADNNVEAGYAVSAIARNFDKLPKYVQNLLFKLAENEDKAGDVASAIADNFDKLPENVRNELLVKLADYNDAARQISYAMADNFDKLPENMRNELLVKLADNKAAAGYVARVVADNFDKLLENVRNQLLVKLADKRYVSGDVANAVADNFDKLPKDVQNLLFKLAENEDIAKDVAEAVASNYNELPKDVQNLLFKLAENEDIAIGVVNAIAIHFDKLPEGVRKLLLSKLGWHI